MKNLFNMFYPVKIKNGDKIKIKHLPSCINARGMKNPYIGMSGTVEQFDGKLFDLFTGKSYLLGVELKSCKFEIIS